MILGFNVSSVSDHVFLRTVGLAETATATSPARRNRITKWLNIEENVDVIDDEIFDLVFHPINLNLQTPSEPLLVDNSSVVVKDSIMKSVKEVETQFNFNL